MLLNEIIVMESDSQQWPTHILKILQQVKSKLKSKIGVNFGTDKTTSNPQSDYPTVTSSSGQNTMRLYERRKNAVVSVKLKPAPDAIEQTKEFVKNVKNNFAYSNIAKIHPDSLGWDMFIGSVQEDDDPQDNNTKHNNDGARRNHKFANSIGGDSSNYK